MATDIQHVNSLYRTIDMTETKWEFDAPHFFDFSRVKDEPLDDETYFSMLTCFDIKDG